MDRPVCMLYAKGHRHFVNPFVEVLGCHVDKKMAPFVKDDESSEFLTNAICRQHTVIILCPHHLVQLVFSIFNDCDIEFNTDTEHDDPIISACRHIKKNLGGREDAFKKRLRLVSFGDVSSIDEVPSHDEPFYTVPDEMGKLLTDIQLVKTPEECRSFLESTSFEKLRTAIIEDVASDEDVHHPGIRRIPIDVSSIVEDNISGPPFSLKDSEIGYSIKKPAALDVKSVASNHIYFDIPESNALEKSTTTGVPVDADTESSDSPFSISMSMGDVQRPTALNDHSIKSSIVHV